MKKELLGFFPPWIITPNDILSKHIFAVAIQTKALTEVTHPKLATLDAVCMFSKWLNPSPLFNIKVYSVAQLSVFIKKKKKNLIPFSEQLTFT